MSNTVITENSNGYMDFNPAADGAGIPVGQPLHINGSIDIHGSTKGTLDENAFFAMFDEIWSKLLMLAKQLRDTMQFYNQKKQELGWGLEINTLEQSFKAIDDSYSAAKAGAIGGMFAGTLTVGGGPFSAKPG